MQNTLVELFSKVTRDKLSKRPELLDVFSPAFGVGCRRVTPGPGYLEALCEDNVRFFTGNIESISKNGLVVSGKHIDVDVIVSATGFNTSSIPPFAVIGRDGVTLAERFSPFPQTYLSLAVADFPNYFLMLGPNSGIAAGSLNPVIEAQGGLYHQMHSQTAERRLCLDDTQEGEGGGLYGIRRKSFQADCLHGRVQELV